MIFTYWVIYMFFSLLLDFNKGRHSRDGRVGHFFPGPGTSRAFFPYSFLNELWLDHNFVSSNRAEPGPGQNKGRAETRPCQIKGLQILSSNFYHFNCYICLAVPHILCRYLSLLHNTCKLLLNGAVILELMMKSIWFWSRKFSRFYVNIKPIL